MLTVDKLIGRGRGVAPALLERAATVELDWDTRSKSRFDATDSAGRRLGVFLPRGTVLRGGDVLVAEDGSLVRVQAAVQALLVVRHCSEYGSPFDLLRAAYHLGNPPASGTDLAGGVRARRHVGRCAPARGAARLRLRHESQYSRLFCS